MSRSRKSPISGSGVSRAVVHRGSVFEAPSPRGDSGRSDRANFPGAMSSLDLSAISDLIPFAAVVGIELLDAGPELVRGRIGWKPERCTAGGVLHGGAIMALADN